MRLLRLHERLPFTDEGLVLRTLDAADAAAYCAGEADPETLRWAYTPEGRLTEQAARERIVEQFPQEALNGVAVRLAIADAATNEFLGHIAYFDDQTTSAEVGFVIAPGARGKRVATRALAAAARLAAHTGYAHLRARTDVNNAVAQRTLERAGFTAVGEPVAPITAGLEHVRLQPFTLPLDDTAADAQSLGELQALVARLLDDTGIPGAQVAISFRGTRLTAAAGTLSVRTGLPVTGNSLFQIGSITKLFTTVLVLQLVDDGLVQLTDRVTDHVPEFTLANHALAEEVRIIDLLQHRGGFDGDYFTDGGRGADAPQALIADLASSEMFFPPGEQFAYSNAGMVVLGRLIEHHRETDYLTAVRERLYAPLGMQYAVTLPEEAILHGTAVGHTRDADGNPVVMPSWQLPMSAAATGAALTMSMDSLTRLGEMLLNGGTSHTGHRILSPELATLMGEREFGLPVASSAGEGFGVGAFTFAYDGATAFGHDGQTVGQVAGFRVVPQADLVIAIATNRENTTAFTEAVIDFALQRWCDAAVVPDPPLPDPPLPPDARFVSGHYANHTMTAAVTVVNGEARLQLGAKGIELGNQPSMRLHRIDDDVYRVTAAEHGVDLKFRFTDTDDDGIANFLWFNRMLRREEPGTQA